MPGETPHPRTDSRGHSHGIGIGPQGPPLTPTAWHRNRAYLAGVDLFNYAYWWEAHEWWEVLWRLAEPVTPAALYLQGLIQIAAAMIKWHQRNPRGLRLLRGRGQEKLEQVRRQCGDMYMGLDLRKFLADLDRFLRIFPEPVPEAYADPVSTPLIRLVSD